MSIHNDVEVFRLMWYDVDPWRVRCAHCETMCAGFPEWRPAYDWAVEHSAEHESRRCEHCGRTS